MGEFLAEYQGPDGIYMIEVPAKDETEAKELISHINRGRLNYVGESHLKIKVGFPSWIIGVAFLLGFLVGLLQ